jgi:hypothetical protein
MTSEDQRTEQRMSQTSGSIMLDTSALSAAIVRGMRPAMEQIEQALVRLAAGHISGAVLDGKDTAPALESHAGGDLSTEQAQSLAFALLRAGLVLVRVEVPPLAGQTAEAAQKLSAEDSWFRG